MELPGLDERARRNSARAVIAAVLAIELFALAAQPTLASDGVAVPRPGGGRPYQPGQPALCAAADHLAGIARDLGLSDDAVLAVVRNALARMTPQRA